VTTQAVLFRNERRLTYLFLDTHSSDIFCQKWPHAFTRWRPSPKLSTGSFFGAHLRTRYITWKTGMPIATSASSNGSRCLDALLEQTQPYKFNAFRRTHAFWSNYQTIYICCWRPSKTKAVTTI
jgi:hypothetical protein